MPEGDQDQRGVPVAVATIPGSFDQLLDFGLGQVFAGSKLSISRPDRN